MIAVIDTNVLVAGTITANAQSPTARIVDAMLCGSFRFACSHQLVREYRQALLYPRVAALHGLHEGEVDSLLQSVLTHAIVGEPRAVEVDVTDSDDRFLFQLAANWPDAILVSGDRAVLAAGHGSVRSVSPATFAGMLGGRDPDSG